MKTVEKIFFCLSCGSKTEEKLAKVEKAKKGWHFCAHHGWVNEQQVTEFEPTEKVMGEPLPVRWVNNK